MAIHILSVEHCALNRIAEVSSPEKFPTSENKDRAQALSRGSKIGLRVAGQSKETGRIKQANHELLALRKATLLTRELGQDDFGKPHVVLAVQTFPFLLCGLLIIGWELLFTFHGGVIPVFLFREERVGFQVQAILDSNADSLV